MERCLCTVTEMYLSDHGTYAQCLKAGREADLRRGAQWVYHSEASLPHPPTWNGQIETLPTRCLESILSSWSEKKRLDIINNVGLVPFY